MASVHSVENRSTQSSTSPSPNQKRKFNWANAAFLILTPVAAIVGLILSLYFYGFAWVDLAIFTVLTIFVGLSVTAGYHRLFSHRTYAASPWVRAFYLFFGAGAMENSALKWSSDHRIHHKYVDQERDPYNIKKGFFWAHMGWIFYDEPDGRAFDNVQDLRKDWLVRFQDKYYLPISIFAGFILPMLIGALFDRAIPGLVFGGFVRTVICHHSTFFVNSAAHVFGRKDYSLGNSGCDSWWVALISFGEGYHNFHHTFAGDYRNGIRWYHWDPAKWVIFVSQKLGLAQRLQRTPDELILKSRMEVESIRANQVASQLPENLRDRIHDRLAAARESFEQAQRDFQEIRQSYNEWLRDQKAQHHADHLKSQLKEWQTQLRDYRAEVRRTFEDYRGMVRTFRRTARSMA